MSHRESHHMDVLILAVDPAMGQVRSRLLGRLQSPDHEARSRIQIVSSPGEALRLLNRARPKLVMLWVNEQHLEPAARLVSVLHVRRPELPLLVVSPDHSAEVEREVRIAGAGYYFALDGDSDPPLLRHTLATLGFFADTGPPNDCGPPADIGPPGSALSPRIRGRPRVCGSQ